MAFDAFISYSHAADGRLAPALQSGLQQFARPWNRMRAIRVFRDKTGLSVTPGLWSAIVAALDSSDHFILLASPAAANSNWVAKEVEHWLARGLAQRLLIVLTDGDIVWDAVAGDMDWNRTNALPGVLRGKFHEEPFWIDLRWALHDEQLSLRNAKFQSAVADLSATLRGIPVDQLKDEDVKQHRKATTLRRAAVAGLVTLSIGLLAAAAIALRQQGLAEQNARAAQAAERETAAQLAAVRYQQSLDTAENQPQQAFALAVAAAEKAPAGDESLERYMDRIVHLADRLPDEVINLPLREGVSMAVFNRSLGIVALVTESRKVHVFGLPEGKPLFVPESVNKWGNAGNPEFLGDDVGLHTYLAWFHPEPDPEERGRYVLEAAWNPLTGAILLPEDNGRISPDDLKWKVVGGENGEELPDFFPPRVIVPGLESSIPPVRGASKDRRRVVAATAQAGILTWLSPQPKRTRERKLASAATWTDAFFAGERLVTRSADGTLAAWDLSTGKMLWTSARRVDGALRLSPDATRILAGRSVLGMQDGRVVAMTANDEAAESRPIAAALTPAGELIHAMAFDTGSRGDDLIIVADYPTRAPVKKLCQPPGTSITERPSSFMDFLANGRYARVGSESSFQIFDVCAWRPLATFYFGESGAMTAAVAGQLLSQVVDIVPDTQTGAVRLRLDGGASLLTEQRNELTAALRLWPGGQPLTAPRVAWSDSSKLALSPDGKRFATASGNSLRIWDALTGQALTRPFRFDGEAVAISFDAGGREVRLTTSRGFLLTVVASFAIKQKPVWLSGLDRALAGMSVAPDGRLVPVPLAQARAHRERLLMQLRAAAEDDIAASFLRAKFDRVEGNTAR